MTRAIALVAGFLLLHTVGLAVWERLEAPCACAPAPDGPRVYPANLGTSTASLRAPVR